MLCAVKLGRHGILRAGKIRELVERLEASFGRQERPYRFDPMEELVSCILTQHSSDASSYPTFSRMREIYPTWEEVAAAGPEALASTIRTAGLANQKAKSILGCLEAIHERVGEYSLEPLRTMGTLEARDWLTSLPGVGPKTASIVLCFSFGRETIPVDTHVFRVSKRLGLLPEKADANAAHDILMELVPGTLAYRFHVALIHHGRTICRAPRPLCASCPLTDLCTFFKANVKLIEGDPRAKRASGNRGSSKET
jgi:endonuclease-3